MAAVLQRDLRWTDALRFPLWFCLPPLPVLLRIPIALLLFEYLILKVFVGR